jgi:signal peptidase I
MRELPVSDEMLETPAGAATDAVQGEAPATPDATPVPQDASDASAEAAPAADEADSWWDLVRILFFALVIALVERTFFFQPYNIPSGSMEDTLLIGDYLFVQKFSYGYSRFSYPWGRLLPAFGRTLEMNRPARGDVAVFALPEDPSRDFIKRVVGLPGDRVQMLHGVLYINDKPVPKVRVADYVEDQNGFEHHVARYRETLPGGKSYYVLDREADGLNDTTQVYTVPPAHYFMMGDNRDDSDDSRGIVGYLPAENLIGKAEFKFFSIDDNKTHAWTFWRWPGSIRYGRLFTFVD